MKSKTIVSLLLIILMPFCLLNAGDKRDDAETLKYRIAHSDNPRVKAELYLRLGDTYVKDQDTVDKALEIYELAVSNQLSKKLSYQAYLKIGDIYLSKNQYANSIEAYMRAAKLYRKKDEVHIKLARAYSSSELYEQAKMEYLTAIKINQQSFTAYLGLADLYAIQGLNNYAMDNYKKALSIKPTRELYVNISKCAYNYGDIGLAISMCKYAISMEFDYIAQVELGKMYLKLGNIGDAETSFLKAIEIEKDRADAYLYLAMLYTNNDERAKAEKQIHIIENKENGSLAAAFISAMLKIKIGEYNSALQKIDDIKNGTKSPVILSYCDKIIEYIAIKKGSVK